MYYLKFEISQTCQFCKICNFCQFHPLCQFCYYFSNCSLSVLSVLKNLPGFSFWYFFYLFFSSFEWVISLLASVLDAQRAERSRTKGPKPRSPSDIILIRQSPSYYIVQLRPPGFCFSCNCVSYREPTPPLPIAAAPIISRNWFLLNSDYNCYCELPPIAAAPMISWIWVLLSCYCYCYCELSGTNATAAAHSSYSNNYWFQLSVASSN